MEDGVEREMEEFKEYEKEINNNRQGGDEEKKDKQSVLRR